MSLIGRIRNRVRAAAAKSRLEREMQEEMREHLRALKSQLDTIEAKLDGRA